MLLSNKTYLKATPRHLRFVVFVHSNIGEPALRSIMQGLLHCWGGRYNPIIPVEGGIVATEWLELAGRYDPDYLYYTPEVDLEYLKALDIFQPQEYIEMKTDTPIFHFPGVNIHALLHQGLASVFDSRPLSVLEWKGGWDMFLYAKQFYQLNLGFLRPYVGELGTMKTFETIKIHEGNNGMINHLIGEHAPFFKSILSSLHVNSVRLRGAKSRPSQYFQWIVYDSSNYFADLLYFWNRQLYIEPERWLFQIVSSSAELAELCKSQFVSRLLGKLCFDNKIYLVSRTMGLAELELTRSQIQVQSPQVKVFAEQVGAFPFEIGSVETMASDFPASSTNVLLGNNDYIRVSRLAFENGEVQDVSPYCLDIVMEKAYEAKRREIYFPYNTSLHHLVYKGKARVNREHRLSLFISSHDREGEISVPADADMIRSLLHSRDYQGQPASLPVQHVEISSAGQKLSAFVHLFEDDWSTIGRFLKDKFWFDIFRSTSEIKDSAIPTGKGIFSIQDLRAEVSALFTHYRDRVSAKLKSRGEAGITEELIDKVIKRDIEEAFEFHLNSELAYLVRRGALFMGMKVKCSHCGSFKWYSLTELRDQLPCKGCNNLIIPNIDSKVYYKINEVVVNNLLNDPMKNGKELDGNYIVLKTLLHLKNEGGSYRDSFCWSPSLDIWENNQSRARTDLDIVVIQDGKFILGEAKADAVEFTTRVTNNLIWIANELLPDKIILAYHHGKPDAAVEKVVAGLRRKCEVVSYKVSRP